jgi:hypothetical protein
MHTDEYEISLSRELHVCENRIKKITKCLAKMEMKYKIKTEVFAVELSRGNITGQKDDYKVWMKEYEALKKWEVLRDQYAALLRRMKI